MDRAESAERELGEGRLVITGSQIREARRLLGWSLDELAEEAGILVMVAGYAENGYIDRIQPQTIAAICRVLESAGVE